MHSGRACAERLWYRERPGLLSMLLLPVAALFGMAVALRRWGYRRGLLSSHRLAVPVMIIGNLTVGGTGKTPLVLWVAEHLRSSGRRPGIILRGYGGSSEQPRPVSPGDDALLVGDEALLLAASSHCPVWTGRDRVAAARELLAAHPDCDLLISDDGLQHYRLARDIEVAVEDERGHGNGLMLPAGPLREPSRRAVDATVVNSDREAGSLSHAGPVFRMRLQPAGFERLDGSLVAAADLAGLRLHAVAGIGNPQRFFDTLSSLGLQFQAHVFADHHEYAQAELQFHDCDAVLMTEKDAVKCRRFARREFIMLRVTAAPDPAFAEFLLKALNGLQTA